MIDTSLSKVKIYEIVQSQIPEYIDFDNPLFGDFLKHYYISQEFQGGSTDIADNFVDYKSLNYLNNRNLIGFTSLSSYTNGGQTTIYVDSTDGWPSQYGLLKIDDEIITYTGIGSTSFIGCQRGFSGIEDNQKTNAPEYLTFTKSGIGTHAERSKVKNLSNTFLNSFLKKLKGLVLPGFEDRYLTGKLNQSNFIRQAKDFYKSKGTKEAFQILFNVLYEEDVSVIKPQEYLFKPSAADYLVNDILVGELIFGDPKKIKSQSITQKDASGSIYEVENIVLPNKTYYKIRLSSDTIVGSFKQSNKTFNTLPVGVGVSIIQVDSTVGFANSGSFFTNGISLNYTDKTYTEFLNVTGLTTSLGYGTTIISGDEAISYENGDLSLPVRFYIVGAIDNFKGEGFSQESDVFINVNRLGSNKKDVKFSSWIHNIASKNPIESFTTLAPNIFRVVLQQEPGYFQADEVEVVDGNNTQTGTILNANIAYKTIVLNVPQLLPNVAYYIRRKLKTKLGFTADVQNTYSAGDDLYVASNSLPHWEINPQKREKVFNSIGVSSSFYDKLFISNHNYNSGDHVIYIPNENGGVSGLTTNQSYYINKVDNNLINLSFSLENVRRGEYITIFNNDDVLNNRLHTLLPYDNGFGSIGPQRLLRKFSIPSYSNIKTETLPGGVGMFVNGVEAFSYKSSDVIYYGSLENVEVLNTGSDYDLINPPRLSIQQSGHVGAGASVVAQIKGKITEILVTDNGSDYIDVPDVVITGGNGKAFARAQLRQKQEVVTFDAATSGGVVSVASSEFTFKQPHRLKNTEEITYNSGGTTEIGINTSENSNDLFLKNNSPYFAIVKDPFTISLARLKSEAVLGIGTIGISTNGGGVQSFTSKNFRNVVDSVNLISSTDLYNRETFFNNQGGNVGVNTFRDEFIIPNHRYENGDILNYNTTGLSVGGVGVGTDYYCIKIDENKFRVSISTDRSDYVGLTSLGSEIHSFNYKPLEISISGSQGITTSPATAKLIARGVIDGVFVKESGDNYGSKIINDNFRPNVVEITGSEAQFEPVIINGKIDSVIVKFGGFNYFNPVDLIVEGDGSAAKLLANISNGKVVSVTVITQGIGYSISKTKIKIRTTGSGAILRANLKKWTINKVQRYANLGDVKDDDGFYESFKNSDYGYPYVNYYLSRKLFDYVKPSATNSFHSGIVGYAYDGHPIYGPYAFERTDGVGNLKYLKPSYVKLSGQRIGGPTISEFEPGFFVEDFTYIEGIGELDEHNGRFAVTPEFPNGVYAYYTTLSDVINKSLSSPFKDYRDPLFPYIIGSTYNSRPDPFNFIFNSDQTIDINKFGSIRNTAYYNIRDYEFISNSFRYVVNQANIESVKRGSVEQDGIIIVNSGSNYKSGDRLIFDNSKTGGFGASGKVKEVIGVAATNIVTTSTTIPNVNFVVDSRRVVGISTIGINSFKDQTPAVISNISDSAFSELEGGFNIDAPIERYFLTTPITDTVGLTTTVTISNNIDVLNVDELVQIDNEVLKVIKLDFLNQKITFTKGENGTAGAAHTFGSPIIKFKNSFSFNLDRPISATTTLNESVFFDPTNSVGFGTTSIQNNQTGIGSTVTFVGAGNSIQSINIPIGGILLKDHPFLHGEEIVYDPQTVAQNLRIAHFGAVNEAIQFDKLLPRKGLFVQVISKDIIGLVTERSKIDNEFDKLKFSPLVYQDTTNIGLGNSQKFSTVRNVLTGDVTTFEVTVSTASTHGLKPLDDVHFDVVSSASSTVEVTWNSGTRYISIGSSVNPPIHATFGDKLIFDTSHFSLLNTRLDFYEDLKFTRKFVGSGVSTIEVTRELSPGITSSKTTLNITENLPKILYYKILSLQPQLNRIEINENIQDNNKIIIDNSKFSGSHSITSTTDKTFNFFLGNTPERVGYTSESQIKYTTSSSSVLGPIDDIEITTKGSLYKLEPKISVASTTGNGAVLISLSNKIGALEEVKIVDFGYDYPSDRTLKPIASVPNLVVLKDNFQIKSVGVRSTGRNYLTPPDLIVYDDKLNLVKNVSLQANLSSSSVSDVTVVSSGSNFRATDNRIVLLNNSNGVGIISATYSDPNVTLRLKTPTGGFTTSLPLPFSVGDKIFVENIGVSTGNGYNSSDYGYEFFTVTEANANFSNEDQATIKYVLNENPGTHDSQLFGSVVNKNILASLDIELEESKFFAGEEVRSLNAVTNVSAAKEKLTDTLRLDSLNGFNVGDLITGSSSGSSGVIVFMEEYFGEFDIVTSVKKPYSWESDSGKPSESYQRIQDSDYYQNFAYSLKSKVGISSWSEPVDSLAHISGYKKHSDLEINSKPLVGSATTSGSSIQKNEIILESLGKIYEKHDFDLVREITDSEEEKSNEVVFNSTRFGSSLLCKSNRVLEIDDISPQFFSDPDLIRIIELDSFGPFAGGAGGGGSGEGIVATKYYAQIVLDVDSGVSFNETQYTEFIVSHSGIGTNIKVFTSQYSDLSDKFDLGEFNAEYSSTNDEISVLFTPFNTAFTYDITFFKESLSTGVGVGTTSYGNIKKVGFATYIEASGVTTTSVIQSFPFNEYKSGVMLVAVGATTGDKNLAEFSWVGIGTTVSFIKYSSSESNVGLGTLTLNLGVGTNTNSCNLEFTPKAGYGVTVTSYTTSVGNATTVSTGIPGTKFEIGDTQLDGQRTEISASSSPTQTVISTVPYTNFHSTKYLVQIENTTKNQVSFFQMANNSYEATANYNKYGNVSTATTSRRDIVNTVIDVSAPNSVIKFLPESGQNYICRVSEIRIDKPDSVADNTTFTLP